MVVERGTTSPAEGARGAGILVLVAHDPSDAIGDPEPLAPASHISGIGGAMCQTASMGMIVPGPKSRVVDFYADSAAQALARDTRPIARQVPPHRSRIRCRRRGQSLGGCRRPLEAAGRPRPRPWPRARLLRRGGSRERQGWTTVRRCGDRREREHRGSGSFPARSQPPALCS